MDDFQKYKDIIAAATHNNNSGYLTYLSDKFNTTYLHEGSEYWRKLLEVSKMHNTSTPIYASASEQFKTQIEVYCASRLNSLLIEESKILTQSQKLDLVLNYYKEKGNKIDAGFDRQNIRWGYLSIKCGGNPGFSILVSKLHEDHFIKDNHIMPHGNNFIGYEATERLEQEKIKSDQLKLDKEEQIRNLEHEKLILEVKKLKEDKDQKNINTINIHGNNSAPISQLSESELNNPIQHTTTKNIEASPPKRSLLEIISWVVGITIGLIGIYEFLLKK